MLDDLLCGWALVAEEEEAEESVLCFPINSPSSLAPRPLSAFDPSAEDWLSVSTSGLSNWDVLCTWKAMEKLVSYFKKNTCFLTADLVT